LLFNWIAWTLNSSGARMDGSLAPVAYQHSNGYKIFIVLLSIFKILFLMLISSNYDSKSKGASSYLFLVIF